MFLKSLTEINGAINNLKSNTDELESLNLIKTSLRLIDKMWGPHMKIEEDHIYEKVGDLNLGLDENNRLREEFSKFFGEHAEPGYLVAPFVLYNLSPEDREIQAQMLPEIVTKQVNTDWKDKWVSMKPFLLE